MSTKAVSYTLATIMAAACNNSPAYQTGLRFVLQHEGIEWEDVPGDSGGATCCGIEQTEYNRWREVQGQETRDLLDMTPGEIVSIYADNYWLPTHCPDLAAPVNLVIFDSAVNCGAVRAAIWLQGACGVSQDGNIGPDTLAAVRAFVSSHDAATLARAVLIRRRMYYQEIAAANSSLEEFLDGWINRVNDLAHLAGVGLPAL